MLRVLVYDTSIGGVMLRQGRPSNLWLYVFGHLVFWPTVLEEGCIVLSDTYLGSWSAWIAPLQALLLFIWMMCLWAPPDLHAWLASSLLLLGRQL